ncbi:hypothetical protein AAC387_Pa02g2807 [Persea americana]
MKYEPPKMEAILISIAHVRVLSLSLPANECLWAGSLQIPIFMNLKKVMIALDFTEERGVIFIVSMLRRCPYLADLTLWGKGDYGTENKLLGLDYWEKQHRFNCFNHSLQRVTIGGETKYLI